MPTSFIPLIGARPGLSLYIDSCHVERKFGRLRKVWALSPLRVLEPDRLRLCGEWADLAKLARAFARERLTYLAA